jgi:hypothetical protein
MREGALQSLVKAGEPPRLSLPAYMRALERGEIKRPPDGKLFELLPGAYEVDPTICERMTND